MMKPRDFNDAQAIIKDIKTGKLGRRDLTALLIYVREQLPDGMVKDIAHCVAHSDRDRGFAYSHVKTFASDFIAAAEGGGVASVKVTPIFPRKTLIAELSGSLTGLGFDVTKNDVTHNIGLIESYLADILADTVLLLQDPKVLSCRFESDRQGSGPRVAFFLQLHNLAIGPFNSLSETIIICPIFSKS